MASKIHRGSRRVAEDAGCLDEKPTPCSTMFNIGELLENILAHLSVRQLTDAQLVCRHWREVIEGEMYQELFLGAEKVGEPFLTATKATCSMSTTANANTSFQDPNTFLADSLVLPETAAQNSADREWHPITVNDNFFKLDVDRNQSQVITSTTRSGLRIQRYQGQTIIKTSCRCPACTLLYRLQSNAAEVWLTSNMSSFPPFDSKAMNTFLTNPPIAHAIVFETGEKDPHDGHMPRHFVDNVNGITFRDIYRALRHPTTGSGLAKTLAVVVTSSLAPNEEDLSLMQKMGTKGVCTAKEDQVSRFVEMRILR